MVRKGAVAALGAALAIAMAQSAPVWADNPTEEETDPAPDTGDGQEPDGDGAGDAGDAADDDHDHDGDEDRDHGSSGGGSGYGGRATGPAELITLPDDPDYPVPDPLVNEGLPEEVDAGATFQRNVVCDPVAKPGTIAVANMLSEHYDRPAYSLSRPCIDLRSEHYDGRAIDWTLNAHDPQERRIGDAAVTWLTENDGEMAHRLGIQSIIWNERSWGAGTGYWQGYAGQSPHTDHIHISLTWDGAHMRTSWWTGVALTEEQRDLGPCDVLGGSYAALPDGARTEACDATVAQVWPTGTDYGTVRPDGQGPGLDLVQPLLDVPQTGVLDQETRAALLEWQAQEGVPTTGVLDQLTYAAALGEELPELPQEAFAVELPDYLTTEFTPHKRTEITEGDRGEAVEALQEGLGMEDADGVFGPLTAEALTEFAADEPLLREDLTTTDTLVWEVLERRTYPLLALRTQELEVGDEGDLVVQLQQLLDVEDDGIFGPLTGQAVKDAQAAAELEPTGVVDGPTWQALEEARVAEQAEVSDDEATEDEATDDEDSAEADAEASDSDTADAGDPATDDEDSADGVVTTQWALVPVR